MTTRVTTNIHQSNATVCADVIQLDDSERQVCEVWTRVMGYHRPVTSFNTGKKGEFKERCYFTENHLPS